LGAVVIVGVAAVVVLPKNGATILPQLTNQIGVSNGWSRLPVRQ
jgi:hypothetical protein